MGWNGMLLFPLSCLAGVIPPGLLQLSCSARNKAMPFPAGAGFTGRKQRRTMSGGLAVSGMCRAMVRGTECELRCKFLELCLSFPMLDLAVVLPAIHRGAPSTHDSAPLWKHLS